MNIEDKIKNAETKQMFGTILCMCSLIVIGYRYEWQLSVLIFLTLFGNNIELSAKIAKIIFKNIK